jgi:fatty acid desaturase
MDWMLPSAWEFEHNILHHYHVGELSDPDFPQKNVENLRRRRLPMLFKYINAFAIMATWKFAYYAPNTLFYLERKKDSNKAVADTMEDEIQRAVSFPGSRIYNPFSKMGGKFWLKCIIPYLFFNFILLPALFLPLGFSASLTVLFNLLLAELITNLHTFATIVTNHAGDDIPYFTTPVKSKAEFYFRQVIGSVNYSSGNEVTDILHCYVNYQIEHHLWPDLPMNKYREIQPKVQAICKKYGVPYVKQNVFVRVRKLLDMMVGKAQMKPMGPIVQPSPAT